MSDLEPVTKAAAAYLPRMVCAELLARGEVRQHLKQLPAAVLLIDMVGSTALADELAGQGRAGEERLARVFTEFFDALVQTVHRYEGDALRFMGDALLAAFPATERSIAEVVHAAVTCARALAEAGGVDHETGGAAVPRRIFVGAGEIRLLQVATGTRRAHFSFAGPGLDDTVGLSAKQSSPPNSVVVSQSAWSHCKSLCAGDLLPSGAWLLRTLHTRYEPPAVQHAQGHALPSLGAIEAYVPEPVVARLRVGQEAWISELRPVSVMFARVRDEQAGLRTSMKSLFRLLAAADSVIAQQDGFLRELVLDDKGLVLMAVFGAPPFAHADDASRCLQAGKDLQEELRTLGWHSDVGIGSGRTLTGVVGTGARREYSVVGEAVHRASRLMERARESLLCDEATAASARRYFDFERLPAVSLKGMRVPVASYRLIAERSTRRKSPAGFVNRRAEIRIIEGLLADVLVGRGHGLSITGDAGIGKTRFTTEIARCARAASVRVVRAAGSFVERNVPYAAWRALIPELALGHGASTGPSVLGPIQAVQDALPEQERWALPLIAAALGIEVPETARTRGLSGKLRAQETRSALRRLIARAAQAQPLAIILDDAHWSDDASRLLAIEVARNVPRALMVLVSRADPPENGGAATPVEGAAFQSLRLHELSPEDALELVCRCLLIEQLPPEPVCQLIMRDGGRNPLFCEELSSALQDDDLIVVEHRRCRLRNASGLNPSLPLHRLGATIRHRIDLLPVHAKMVLQLASVLGATFTSRQLESIYPSERARTQVRQHVEHLCERNLLVPVTPATGSPYSSDARFAFKHGLVQQEAYELTPYARRAQYHEAAAKLYEAHEPGFDAVSFDVLAHHWERAGDLDKAVHFLLLSAQQAFAMGLGHTSVERCIEAASLLQPEAGWQRERLPAETALQAQLVLSLTDDAGQGLGASRSITDPLVEQQLNVLATLAPLAFQSNDMEVFALAVLRAMALTLQHGEGAAAPFVYSLYSIVFQAGPGADRWQALEFSELARTLDARTGRQQASRVDFVHTWFHNHWANPISSSIDIALEGARAGADAGDVLFECFNLSAAVVYKAAAGAPLPEVERLAREHLGKNGGRVNNAAFHCILELQMAKALSGRTVSPLALTDDEYDEATDLAWVLEAEYWNQHAFHMVSFLKRRYMFGCYHEALYGGAGGAQDGALKMEPLIAPFLGQVCWMEYVFYRALAITALASEQNVADALLDTARRDMSQLAAWSEHCRANFSHKAALVQAEIARVEQRHEQAGALYATAVAAATSHGFLQDLAIAHELRGKWLADQEHSEQARATLRDAETAYRAWGATAKLPLNGAWRRRV